MVGKTSIGEYSGSQSVNRQLDIVLMPDNSLQLEWVETEEQISQSTVLFQEEVQRRFLAEPDIWLLHLADLLQFCADFVGL